MISRHLSFDSDMLLPDPVKDGGGANNVKKHTVPKEKIIACRSASEDRL